MQNMGMRNLLNLIIPISRFNKGEAAKIFEEVDEVGYKLVVKNNKPACVLLSPKQYEKILDELEDLELMSTARERLERFHGECISEKELLEGSGITEQELEEAEDVELE